MVPLVKLEIRFLGHFSSLALRTYLGIVAKIYPVLLMF